VRTLSPQIKIEWLGPYGWPKFEGDLPSIPKVPGVYLLTIEYQNGYLIYAAGITRRPMQKRFREHTREYMDGVYNVLDIVAMKAGFRKEVWHGFWMTKKRPREKLAEYKEEQLKIQEAVRKQLAGFRIFAADIGTKKRILERLEAAIMENLYKQPMPLCEIPDRGMKLTPRRKSEIPIIVKNKCSVVLHGLPACIEI
jgi:hypothetical protein